MQNMQKTCIAPEQVLLYVDMPTELQAYAEPERGWSPDLDHKDCLYWAPPEQLELAAATRTEQTQPWV